MVQEPESGFLMKEHYQEQLLKSPEAFDNHLRVAFAVQVPSLPNPGYQISDFLSVEILLHYLCLSGTGTCQSVSIGSEITSIGDYLGPSLSHEN